MDEIHPFFERKPKKKCHFIHKHTFFLTFSKSYPHFTLVYICIKKLLRHFSQEFFVCFYLLNHGSKQGNQRVLCVQFTDKNGMRQKLRNILIGEHCQHGENGANNQQAFQKSNNCAQ